MIRATSSSEGSPCTRHEAEFSLYLDHRANDDATRYQPVVERLNTYCYLPKEEEHQLNDPHSHDQVCTPGHPEQTLALVPASGPTGPVPLPNMLDLNLYSNLCPLWNGTEACFELTDELVAVLGLPELSKLVHAASSSGGADARSKSRSRFVATSVVARMLFGFEKAVREQGAKNAAKKGSAQKAAGKAGAGKNKGFFRKGKGREKGNGVDSTSVMFKSTSPSSEPPVLQDDRPFRTSEAGHNVQMSSAVGARRADENAREEVERRHVDAPEAKKQRIFLDNADAKVFVGGVLPTADTPESRALLRNACTDFCFVTAANLGASNRADAARPGVEERALFERALHAHRLGAIAPEFAVLDLLFGKLSLLHEECDSFFDEGRKQKGPQTCVDYRWSQFRLWATLAPQIKDCAWFVPRFFLVDIAAAMEQGPYSTEREVRLVVDTCGRIFVAQAGKFADKSYNDGQRQGYHFESKVLDGFSAGGRTHLLTSLRFPRTGMSCVYSSAPDFAFGNLDDFARPPAAMVEKMLRTTSTSSPARDEEKGDVGMMLASDPQQGNGPTVEKVCTLNRSTVAAPWQRTVACWLEHGYSAAGPGGVPGESYSSSGSASGVFSSKSEAHASVAHANPFRAAAAVAEEIATSAASHTNVDSLTLWKVRGNKKRNTESEEGDGQPVYGELKRTRHLFGKAGQLKKLKFWLQAFLGGLSKVVVGMDASNAEENVIRELHAFAVEDLVPGVPQRQRCLYKLEEVLHWAKKMIVEKPGVWTLRIEKEADFASSARVKLKFEADQGAPEFIQDVFLQAT
eukprot:g8071.t1